MHFRRPPWHVHNPHVRPVDQLSVGERAADGVVRGIGSWWFLLWQTIIVVLWILGNVYFGVIRFDPFPFILLNLAFSTQAAYATPIVLLSNRRQDTRNAEVAQGNQRLLLAIAKKLEIEP